MIESDRVSKRGGGYAIGASRVKALKEKEEGEKRKKRD